MPPPRPGAGDPSWPPLGPRFSSRFRLFMSVLLELTVSDSIVSSTSGSLPVVEGITVMF